MYHIYRARKHVRLIYATGWRFIHNVKDNWYVGEQEAPSVGTG